jgi:plastocyanin
VNINGKEHVEVDISTVKVGDAVTWTDKHGQHINYVLDVKHSGISLKRHAHEGNSLLSILPSSIKKCWRIGEEKPKVVD